MGLLRMRTHDKGGTMRAASLYSFSFSSAPYVPPVTYGCQSYDASAATGGQETDVSKRSIAQYFAVVHATFFDHMLPFKPAAKQLAHPYLKPVTAIHCGQGLYDTKRGVLSVSTQLRGRQSRGPN